MDQLLTFAEIGRMLDITRQAVWSLYQRRDRSGFPEAVGWTDGPRPAPRFNKQAVLTWSANRTRSKGGAPTGNRNRSVQPIDTDATSG